MPQKSGFGDAKPSAQAQRFTQLCAGAAFGIALLAAAGWLFHARLLAGQWGRYIPVSPSTALAFLLLSSGVFGQARWRWSAQGQSRRFALAAAGISALLGLLVLAQFFTGFDSKVEWVLSRTNELAGDISLGRMSPLTAGAFLLESGALMLLLLAARWRFAASGAALLALLGAAGGLVVSVGYAYGAPLLYGGSTIPVALPTALAFLLLGAGEISLALPGVPAVRGWMGDSTRGILIRAFLPAMLLFVLIEDWLTAVPVVPLNPVLLHSLTALVVCVLIVLLTGWTVRRVGDALDRGVAELLYSEERFRRMFQHSATGMVLVSPDFRFVQVNDAFCKMLGYSESELVGKTFQDVTFPEDRPVGGELTRRALSGETEIFHSEKRYLHKDGTVVWGLVVSTLIRDTQGKPLHFVTQIQDITERKRAEEELRESREVLRAVLNSIPVRVFWKDKNLVYLGCNVPLARDAGLERPEELIGKDDYATNWRDQAEQYRADDRAVIESGVAKLLFEETQTTPSGERISLLTSKLPLRDADGEIVGVLGTYYDITDSKRAADALRGSEERHRTIIQTAMDGFWLADMQGHLLEVNETYCRMSGYSAGELCTMSIADLEANRPRSDTAAHMREIMAQGEERFESRHRRKDGSVFDVEIGVRYLERDGGQLVVFLRDITERKQAETALRESEVRFRVMADGCPASIWVIGTEGELQFINRTFREFCGLTLQPLEGGKWEPPVHPDDALAYAEAASRALRERAPFRVDARMRRADGEWRWLASSAEPRFSSGGEFLGHVGLSLDITERKRTEEELRASEKRSRMLARALQCADECISVTDIEDRLLYVNEAFCRTYGYREGELIGQHIGLLRSERTSTEIQSEILPATIAGRWHGELWNRTKDGREFLVSLDTSTVYDEDGQTVALVGIARDITERKLAEEEKTTLQAQLLQAQKMESIGRLAGGVAHDFNNLLTVINGYSQMLLAKLSEGDPLRDTLTEIHTAGERAAALTRQLLAFSRKQVLEPRRLDINRVVTEMQPMLERLVGEDIEVRVALHAEGGTIHADPHQLEQVVMNLAVNARDAMPNGGKLLIETARVERDESYPRSHPEAHAGSYVMLAVSDTGVGMDEETKGRIFEPFFTTKGIGKGTGLGLSMVQGIVAQSGGYIEVYSEPGHGTTFKIYMPALDEAATDGGRPEAVPAMGGKETVLVVEDQADVRKYVVAVLRAKGYRVIPAENAGEAALLCEQQRIDLVVTDVVMPHVSGRELADRLEKLRPGINVLFMSGYTDNVIVHHGVLEAGAKFIQKPFSPEELAGKVREALGPAVTAAPAARILVADDEAGVRGFLRTVLERAGYEVIEAADGKQALRRATAGGVDLVITDLVMPEQEGIETIQRLRRDVPGIGIIAISGAFEGNFLRMAQLLGADAVLSKPVGAQLLVAKVAEVLKARR